MKKQQNQRVAQSGAGKETGIQALKFFLFSISAGLIETGVYGLLHFITDWKYWPCYLLALTASVVWNFTLNREFTFKSAGNVPVAMVKILAFYAVFTPLSTWWGHMLTERAGWNSFLVLLFTMAINLITEFLYDRFFVFRNTINTNQRARREKEGR